MTYINCRVTTMDERKGNQRTSCKPRLNVAMPGRLENTLKPIAFASIALLAGCAAPAIGTGPPAVAPARALHAAASGPIQHIVIVMQENRSFDNFFHDFPGADGASFGYGHGVKYPLQPLPLKWSNDINHYRWQFLEDYDGGKNDGFDNQIYGFKTGKGCADPKNHPNCWIFHGQPVWKKMAYSYVKRSQIAPYWEMARRYALGDKTFASNNGPTFVAHQYMIAGQADHASEVPSTMPWGCDAPKESEYYLKYGQAKRPAFPAEFGHEVLGPAPCFPLEGQPSSSYPTIADLLDAAGVSWRYYVQPHYLQGQPQDSFWLNAFDAVKAIRYGPDWQRNISTPDTNVLTDIQNGDLQQVSWVMPHGGASDHAGGGSDDKGPDWVTSIVNAIGHSKYWNSTAIVILWDEWGGWYDHVVPPQLPDPQTGAYEGLGYRVPLIVVSPYVKPHYISHKRHEVASTLHFIENTFGLPFLGAGSGRTFADRRADAFDDIFDYTQPPLQFRPIKPLHDDGRYFMEHQWEPEIDY